MKKNISNQRDPLRRLLRELNSASSFNESIGNNLYRNSEFLKKPEVQHHVNGLLTLLESTISRDLNLRNKAMGLRKTMTNIKKVIDLDLPVVELNFRLPNVKLGSRLDFKVLPDHVEDRKLSWLKVSGEVSGIEVDLSQQTIGVHVDEAKDYKLRIIAFDKLPTGKYQRVILSVQVSVIPDPKSLWKALPSDSTARFHKPDKSEQLVESKSFVTFASSVRGRSHAHKGTHRDDDFCVLSDESSGWMISCVADGAGSCKFSRQGAYIASKKSVSVLKEALLGPYGEKLEAAVTGDNAESTGECLQNTIVKAVYSGYKAIFDSMDTEQGDTVKDFSTTLILSAIKKVADGYLLFSFWIGDGGIFVLNSSNEPKLLGVPDSGQYAGQTRFLDGKLFEGHEIYDRIKFEKLTDLKALILATDGITDAWFETEAMLENPESWNKLWPELEQAVNGVDKSESLQRLTEWMDFWSPGNHDDRTITITLPKE
ncbi:protein phosphatase 2C domain-containing protein [Vibrio alginolyticus]|uniref:PP2C family serine/threonine-protein phosphatase n=1 Tax=Vibrio TaxID=662 RepID=UPI001CDC43C3|nr:MULTISPECIES: PP2C family serine/threonine-protein phosphatase [Vibrio]MCA2452950.1 protein phosphatase 2C domain-containing protein [Vibrio alginolyticus]MDW2232952.1 PP2C family serine/threonine-protein phosphatase [Vibrio sp. 2091]